MVSSRLVSLFVYVEFGMDGGVVVGVVVVYVVSKMECGAVGGRSCGVAKPGKCCSDTEALNIRFPAWHRRKLDETGMSGLLRDVQYEGNISICYNSEILVN